MTTQDFGNVDQDEAWNQGLEELHSGLEQLREAAQRLLNADGNRRFVADRVISTSLLVIVDCLFPNWREELPSLKGDEDMAIYYVLNLLNARGVDTLLVVQPVQPLEQQADVLDDNGRRLAVYEDVGIEQRAHAERSPRR
jgi:hypothetical protein